MTHLLRLWRRGWNTNRIARATGLKECDVERELHQHFYDQPRQGGWRVCGLCGRWLTRGKRCLCLEAAFRQ